MVTNNPVRVGRRLLATVTSSHVSVQIVVETVEETILEVHVSDGVNVGEFNRARNLTVASSPVVLDAFHVHLVHNYHDSVALSLFDLREEVLVSLVNKNFFEFRAENIGALDEPVHEVRVNTFLSEGRGSNKSKFVSVVKEFVSPLRVLVSVALHDVVREVHAGFVIKSLPGG